MSLAYLFIFIMAFIDGGIIIAIFFSIWNACFLLTLILTARYFRNQELNEIKKKIKSNDIETEIIDRSCIVIKGKNEFRIKKEWFCYKIGCLFGLLITLIATVPILILGILLQFLKHMEVRDYSSLIAIILIFIIPLNIPWIIAYLYYRNRKTECFIDKASEVILFKKLLPNYKILKKIIFSDVETFGNSLTDPWSSTYSLKFTDINGVKTTVFEGDEEECTHIYNEISYFLGFKFQDEGES